jgi:N-terminal half of MaoC dehydratase
LPPAATAALPTVAAEPELATAIGEALALTELKGQQTGTQKVVIERCPVRVFAEALGDASDAYTGDGAPVPPRFPFVMPYWGSLGTGGAPGLPIDRLRGPDRAILHGEQAFEYHRWPKVGDVLEGTTVITDVYEKERSNGGKLEFYVTETDWKDADSGKPIVKSIFTLVVNVRPSS